MGEFSLGDIVAHVKADLSGFIGGIEEAKTSSKSFGENFKDTANKVAIGLGAVGAGMTLFAKNATDFTVDYVKNSKALAREIGTTTAEASRLTFALGRMGITADQASTVFGIFSKKIQAATGDAEKNRNIVQALQVQMEKTRSEINNTSEEIRLHGDKTGDLGIKLRGLQSDYSNLAFKLKDTGTAFDKLGIELTDNSGKQKDFKSILMEVADQFKGMPNGVEKTALSMELFGRSGKDMVKVLNLGSAGIQDLETQADKLGITLTDKTVGGVAKLIESQKKLKENSDAIKLAVGTLTAPVLASFNEQVAKLIGKFQTLSPAAKTVVANILAFGGPVLDAAGGFLAFTANLATTIPGMIAAVKVVKEWTIIQWLFNASLWANPITWIVLGIAAFIAIVVIAYEHSKTFRDIVNGAFSAVWNTIKGIWDWIGANWPALLGILFNPFGTAVVWIVQHWDVVVAVFKAMPGQLSNILSGVGNAIIQPFKDAFDWVKKETGAVVNKLKDLNPFQRHSPSLYDLIESGTTAITQQYKGMFKDINGMASKFGPKMAQTMVSSASSFVTNVNGPVNIGSTNDADYFFKRLTRGQELAKAGIAVPVGGLG